MSQSSERQVLVTGLGVVSPIGIGRQAFRDKLFSGGSGIGRIELLSYTPLPQHIAGEIKDFDSKKHVKLKKSIKVMCREIQLGVASATMAMEDAGIEPEQVDPDRLGVDFGANLML